MQKKYVLKGVKDVRNSGFVLFRINGGSKKFCFGSVTPDRPSSHLSSVLQGVLLEGLIDKVLFRCLHSSFLKKSKELNYFCRNVE